jgi:hypothetical protein
MITSFELPERRFFRGFEAKSDLSRFHDKGETRVELYSCLAASCWGVGRMLEWEFGGVV